MPNSYKLDELAGLANINLDAYESDIITQHFSRLAVLTDKLIAFDCNDLKETINLDQSLL